MSTESSPAPSDPTQPLPVTPAPHVAASASGTPAQPGQPEENALPAAGRRRVRVSDVVWGGLFVLLGLGLLARAIGVRYDTELALIIGLALGGLALVGTALVNGARRR